MRRPSAGRARVALVGLLAFAAIAFAATTALAATATTAGEPLGGIGLTISQTSGGVPTRFTFTANASAPVSALSLAFPDGFDLSRIKADVVTLEGLRRTPIDVTQDRSGSTVNLRFKPVIAAGSEIRVQVHDVMLPLDGGTFSLRVGYEASGVRGSVETPPFRFETVTNSQTFSRWLDQQSWVQSWNSVPFFNIFVQPQQIAIAVPLLFAGWLMSVSLVGVAFPVAIVGGLALAFLKMSKVPPIRWIASGYINVIRGTPLFLQIYIAFVGLPIAGFRAPLFITAIVVLALNSSAYLAEIFRAGIQSINKGQFEAASSLGMTYSQAMAYVIIPQTVKRVLPTMTSEFILLFKDTALLSAVGVFELMLYSNSLATRSGNLTPFVVAAAYYLIVTIPLINWVSSLEHRLAVSEGGQVPTEKKRGGLFGRLGGRGDLTPPALAPGVVIGGTPEEHESR
jgi:His/Glu/Gln/Arg/opine family amino acid ABC transporter permease subunit